MDARKLLKECRNTLSEAKGWLQSSEASKVEKVIRTIDFYLSMPVLSAKGIVENIRSGYMEINPECCPEYEMHWVYTFDESAKLIEEYADESRSTR